jgi:hypothetical protein
MTTPASSRELQERAERLARTDAYAGSDGREGYVPLGGSIAQIRTRDVHTNDVAPDPKAQQQAIIAAMQSQNATHAELEQLGQLLKTHPQIREAHVWSAALSRLRRFRGGSVT